MFLRLFPTLSCHVPWRVFAAGVVVAKKGSPPLCNRIGEHFAIMWDCASTEQKFARDWIWKAVFEQAPYLGAVAFVGAGTMGLIPMGL